MRNKEITITELADEVEVSIGTMSKILYGETRAPRADTLAGIMLAVGLEGDILDVTDVDKPISEVRAQGLKARRAQRRR